MLTSTMEKNKKLTAADLVYIAVFAGIMAVCSWISIPAAVPFTMQTFAVFFAFTVLGGRRGTLAVLVYILMGVVGLPVFAGFQGGIGALAGASGGYIIGFLGSALVMWGMEKLAGRKPWMQVLIMILGNAVLALGTAAFVVPNGLISGGVTGIGLILEHFFGLPVDVGVFVGDAVLFLLGAAVMGKAFAATIILSTIVYPTFFSLFGKIPFLTSLTDDKLMAAIYAGLLMGAGIGLVIKVGGSTGGMDIPPIILHKLFGLSIPVMIYVGDTALLLIQAIYSSTEQVLYGILVVLLSSIVMDKVLIMGQKQTQVVVISPQYEKINQMIHQQMDRGSTLLHATTGLEKSDQKVVMTVISNRQLAHLNELILQIDPQAFVVASEVNEVKGRGFTLSKLSKNIAEK